MEWLAEWTELLREVAMLKESQEQERHVGVVPREVKLRQLIWFRRVQSLYRRWSLGEKEAQQEHLTIAGEAVFFVFEMLSKGRRRRKIAKEEVDKKASAETEVARMEAVEVSGEHGTDSIWVLVWMNVRVGMYLTTTMVRACLGPNVSTTVRGLVVAKDAWVAGGAALDTALSKNTAGIPSPWTWAQDRETIAGEAAGSG